MPTYKDAARIVIAVDPAVTSTSSSDEVGIVVCARSLDHTGYVLEDLSGRFSPERWARRVSDAYWDLQADRVVAEVNNGGDMVEAVLRMVDKEISYKAVHASRGKQTRAEPIVALYEKGRIFHTRPFPALEDELCNWDPTSGARSPSRLDALVWGFTELFLGMRAGRVVLI
jgi:phage terminase large subunit-like protein